jgi:hypothetical protein
MNIANAHDLCKAFFIMLDHIEWLDYNLRDGAVLMGMALEVIASRDESESLIRDDKHY